MSGDTKGLVPSTTATRANLRSYSATSSSAERGTMTNSMRRRGGRSEVPS